MPTKTTKAASRPKRGRGEVEQEFLGIQEEAAAARQEPDAKLQESLKRREGEVRLAVEGVSVEGVVQRVSGLGLEISKALADLSQKLVEEVNSLTSIREAVGLETRELERLHKIDIAATALDQLVQDYARQKEQLESEITAQRTAWEEERRQAERDRKEYEDNLKRQRQREVDDYEYRKTLERKKAQDKYEEEVQLREKQNREKQEALNKTWQARESALKEREEELTRLRKEVEEFPARLQKEIERAAAEAARATERKFEQQILLLNKGAETEGRLAELRIKTLEETLSRQTAQMEALQKHLDEAKQQVQEIAVKAIEGASGARALAHINQIAMEQAKTRSPQG